MMNKIVALAALFSSGTFTQARSTTTQDSSHIKDALDLMQTHFDVKPSKFDQQYYDKILKCMGKYDDNLLVKSQDNAWKKFKELYYQNGIKKLDNGFPDEWGNEIMSRDVVGFQQLKEQAKNATSSLRFGDMVVYEPCNYASNIAYFHSMTRLCDYQYWDQSDEEYLVQIKRMFATMAFGSSLFHASSTHLGDLIDNYVIAIIAYLGH